jgi:hypothetical protein
MRSEIMTRASWIRGYLVLLIVFVTFYAADASFAGIEIPKFVDKVDAKSEANKIAEGAAVFLYVLAGVVAVFGILVGGIKIMDDKSEEGWQKIKNALLGTAVIVFSGAIIHIFS